jgi:hypothetical protein
LLSWRCCSGSNGCSQSRLLLLPLLPAKPLLLLTLLLLLPNSLLGAGLLLELLKVAPGTTGALCTSSSSAMSSSTNSFCRQAQDAGGTADVDLY